MLLLLFFSEKPSEEREPAVGFKVEERYFLAEYPFSYVAVSFAG
jgi:hypothetical protein